MHVLVLIISHKDIHMYATENDGTFTIITEGNTVNMEEFKSMPNSIFATDRF